jgi:hypothetical protein
MHGPYDFAEFDWTAASDDLLPAGLAVGFFMI